MSTVRILIRRNVKLFFKDKGMFFTALITPGILLVLYATFLSGIYRDTFLSVLPEGLGISDSIIGGLVGGQLMSSILAVSCVTVAFCSNFLMVQDRAHGNAKDFFISPVSPATMSVAYYAATVLSTLLICYTACALCLVYIACIGWYISLSDILFILLDVFILVLFGTALSSVIAFFLSTQGQISAVGTVISSGYGFISGAYMPISSFGHGLRNIVAFLPGTYGTALLRNHTTRGALAALGKEGVPTAAIDGIRDAIDCNIYFFDTAVKEPVMFLILAGASLLLLGVYILMHRIRRHG